MVAPLRPGPQLVPDDQRTATLMIAVVVVVLAVLSLAWVAAFRVFHDDSPPVHTYNGTTWVGDSCFVDQEGVLWCQGGSV